MISIGLAVLHHCQVEVDVTDHLSHAAAVFIDRLAMQLHLPDNALLPGFQ